MTEILQNWLAKRIALATDASLESITLLARDGRLYGDLLYNYNIISFDQRSQIIPTDNDETAYQNLKNYVAEWLKSIHINCSDNLLHDVAKGKATAAIKLLYKMYLVLQDKDLLYFTNEQIRKGALASNDSRFMVTRVPDEGPPFPKIEPNVLSQPLVDQDYTILWHKGRLESLREKCRITREKYRKYLEEKFAEPPKEDKKQICITISDDKVSNSPVVFEVSNKNQTYDELLAEETTAKETKLEEVNVEKARQQFKQIVSKNRQKTEEKAKKLREQKVLLLEMWEKIISEQEHDFDENISKRFVQQSQYEKQMTEKMLHTRQQKENMMEHRKALEDEIDKQKQFEFATTLLAKEISTHNQKDNYYIELERNMELHRRLYAEKLRLKAERIYNMCLDCVKDITSVALRHSEFKKQFLIDVPRRVRENWKHLFVKGQPIFDLLEQPDDLVQGYVEELPEEIEEIYSVEMSRQNAMDDVDFENYCKYKWPFDLNKYDLYDERKMQLIEAGLNILSHIVHRLLLIKYPKPPQPKPPDLPPVNIAVCMNGVSDETILPTLQRLLNLKGIKIITLEDSINYCLQAYKDETKQNYYEDTTLEEETAAALKKLSAKKLKKKGIEPKGKKKNAKSKEADPQELIPPPIEEGIPVAIQTPKMFPGDIVNYSKAAQLGKELEEHASFGESLPDDLVAAAFVEFLITMKEIKGWALVNFPFNINQAASLEEALTARPFPLPTPEIENELDDIIEVKHRNRSCEEDKRMYLRKSKILPNLEGSSDEELLYRTCLSAFINIKQATEDLSEDLTELPPLSEILETSADPVVRFYTEQGCNYTFYYQVFDIPTIKHLAKLIIGEFSIPPKTSLELFGDTVLYVEQNVDEAIQSKGESKSSKRTTEKKPKIKSVVKGSEKPASISPGPAGDKVEEKGKKGKGKKAAVKVKITYEEKETQIPEVEEEIIEILVDKEPEAQPGEKRWVYVDLPLSNQFETILATFWENTEDIYITDFKQLFFVRRTLLDAVIPYTSYVERHMGEFISRPDDKLKYIQEFQRMYNEFDADMRDDDEVKAELHCRVAEFREKLWTICDGRSEECENERKRIIAENWVTTQICHLVNNAILMFQIEVDRFVETMQLLSDYYLASITKRPMDISFAKTQLQAIKCSSTESFEQMINSKLKNVVELILTHCEIPYTDTPFHDAIQKAYNEANGFVQEIFSLSMEAHRKGALPLSPTKEKKAPKGKKIDEPDPLIKQKGHTVLVEWMVALDGEMERLQLQLALLKAVAKKDLEDVFRCSQEAFCGIYRNIKNRYEGEIQSVNAACNLFASAIEAEMPIQPQLILEGDRFYIQPDVILFPEKLPEPEPEKIEVDYEGVFKMSQLQKMVDILLDLAPNGLIIGRRFTFLLQDMITLDAEDGAEAMVPDLYKRLTPKQVEVFLKELFGSTELIDWKDFIIYHLHVKFPTEDELLQTRSEFHQHDPDHTELIKDYQFFTVKLWFETCAMDEEKRMLQLKNLLFKMYRINEDTMNYTAMLLAFCKDENVVRGMAKALELSLGRYVCWDRVVGESCVEALLSQRELDVEAMERHEQQRQENLKAAAAIVEDIVDYTVHVCDSVIIEDVISDESTKSSGSLDGEGGIDNKWMNPDLHVYSSASLLDDDRVLAVGTDVAPSPGRVYFLPFETLITVITAAFPWHARTQNLLDESLRQHLEVIYESCKSELFNGAVLMHEFLNNEHFLKVIQVTFKFVAKEPVKIIKELLAE